jgi:hypothetical protein
MIVNLITLSDDDIGTGHAAQIWSFYFVL